MSCYFGFNNGYNAQRDQSVYYAVPELDEPITAVETLDALAPTPAEYSTPQGPTVLNAALYSVGQNVAANQTASIPPANNSVMPAAVQQALDDYWRCKEALDAAARRLEAAARRLEALKQGTTTATYEEPSKLSEDKIKPTLPRPILQPKSTTMPARAYQQDMSLYFGDDELNNMHAAYAPRPVEYHYAPANYGQSVPLMTGTNHSNDGFEQDAKKAIVDDSVNTGIEIAYAPRQATSQYHWAKLHEYAAWDHALPVSA